MTSMTNIEPARPLTLDDVLFVGFNSRVAAIAKSTGKLLWQWKAPKGLGYTSLMLDGERLFASVQGYLYCLDPTDGRELWSNPLSGFGLGVTCFASSTATGGDYGLIAEAEVIDTTNAG